MYQVNLSNKMGPSKLTFAGIFLFSQFTGTYFAAYCVNARDGEFAPRAWNDTGLLLTFLRTLECNENGMAATVAGMEWEWNEVLFNWKVMRMEWTECSRYCFWLSVQELMSGTGV